MTAHFDHIRTSDSFAENFGAELTARVGREAPSVRLHFVKKHWKDSVALRDRTVDLETGRSAGASFGQSPCGHVQLSYSA